MHTRQIREHLAKAQDLTEQILGHYGSLRQASEALTDFCVQNQLLPEPLLRTVLYACVREHPLLGVFMGEVYEMYANLSSGQEFLTVKCFMSTDRRFKEFPDPLMIGQDGVLRYEPSAYRLVHGPAFEKGLTDIFRKGADALEQLLSLYPDMTEASRNMLDFQMAQKIYASQTPDDSPIRRVLREKLDDVKDAQARIDLLFESEMINKPDSSFLQRMEFVFNFLETLDAQKAQEALLRLTYYIEFMVERNPLLDGQPVECMTKVLNRAKSLGYEPLSVLANAMKSERTDKDFVHHILKNFTPSPDEESCASMWMVAAVLSLDDQKLLEMDLPDRHLAWISGRTGSSNIRNHLLKKGAGRDMVMAQDLGL
ncbi:hypothetical protein [Pseudomonas amygdali]|uniref:Uncharacterized protein n=1 Tax=Pseudomonas amygdali pv. lachrymans str. M301315 TaxID=629260 RepID=A0AAD0M4D5_PSEAV|nr:hypothetical protein PLA107_030625 [Pseudomonas amygdali pv. lachrymans str. M301315]